ncbi:sulfurtransferase [Wenjunlia tyrosinilytica]|uniref:Sulfurtransferase n=1 Tax=Wenjunlia tyrosinilytica TaxID=1544741 RepID=A0A917ZT34_9ACTN|nr:sulfurtransferase [Wenjunlia tyrosinilytica]GGO91292.1 sulfurtransferase [Wenjunlia tyrosinilytica]
MEPITTTAELSRDLEGSGRPVLLDARWKLGGPPGRSEYESGHIPGAHYIDLSTELAGPPGRQGRHPLPPPEVFETAMRRAGVSARRDVVVYDGGDTIGAARAWWMLRWAGHDRVRVLDGGLRAWSAAGLPLERGTVAREEGDFTVRPGGMKVLDADEAAALARSGLLLDARAGERYRGEVEPIDSVAGHIPGAVGAPTAANMTEDGRFLPREALAERFHALGATPAAEVGVYCGSGVSAAQQVIALELAGVEAALYVGSWSEWSADPSRPVAKGPERG